MTDLPPLLVITSITPPMRAVLEANFTLHHTADMADPKAWLAENGAGIAYVLTDGHLGVRADYMEALPDVKVVSSYGVGYDAIDTDTAVARGVIVTHTPGVLNAEVATTALMLLMACYRQLPRDLEVAHSGRWAVEGNAPLTHSVDNRTIGILGMGRIGQAIADKLAPFNPRILYHTRSVKDVPYQHCPDLVAMAQEADALISIVPGGASTQHLVNAGVMAALGPEGVLINVGRGSTVDEAALVVALSEGRLGMAGLDVFEDEPRIPDALRVLPNAILLPHVGSATVETRAAMGTLAIDNLLAHLKDGSVVTAVPECAGLVG